MSSNWERLLFSMASPTRNKTFENNNQSTFHNAPGSFVADKAARNNRDHGCYVHDKLSATRILERKKT